MSSVLVSPIGRVCYPSLFAPNRFSEEDKPEYDVTLIFDDASQIAEMRKRILEAVKQKWGPEGAKSVKSPLRRVEEKPEYEALGYEPTDVFVRFKTRQKPACVGPDKRVISEADEVIYPGCYGRVSYEIGCWQHPSGGKGVSLYLRHFQFARDGERIASGRGGAEDEFDALPVDSGAVEVFDDDLNF
jgi:hypothetical protein